MGESSYCSPTGKHSSADEQFVETDIHNFNIFDYAWIATAISH